jgi:multiple antibiotic resistance protein
MIADASFWSVVLVFLLVIDPLGNLPIFLAALRSVQSAERRRTILIRECLIALLILFVFLGLGRWLLALLGLSQTSVGIAGGIVLFLISLRMIFDSPEKVFGGLPQGEPFIVPLAVPFLAGPSALATILILAAKDDPGYAGLAIAVTIAMLVSLIILILGSRLMHRFGERGLDALQRLMGLVLTAIAVEMFLRGVREFVGTL